MNTGLSNLPEKFIDRLTRIVPQDKRQSVFDALCTKCPSSIRANTLKITADDLERELTNMDLSIERVLWYPDAFLLQDNSEDTLKMLTNSPLYTAGCFYIQSLSSMIPPLILDPQPGEKILDIAAAQGSKTTQMAAMMRNTGEIVANDISNSRLYKLKANLEHQHVTNTKVIRMPGQLLWRKYPEYFDRSLVDVPCSLEGRINCYDPKTYQEWSPKKVEILSQRERFLLRSAVSATKPGGIIVYSTCTLSPEENEEVIDWLIKKEQNAVDIEQIDIHRLPADQAILHWRKQTFDPHIMNTVRIFPSATMEGFFVAKIRKLRSTLNYHR